MNKWFAILFVGYSSIVYGKTSCSDEEIYREICRMATVNDTVFQNFRSFPHYRKILEKRDGTQFAEHIIKTAPQTTLRKLQEFKKLDSFGKPDIREYDKLGEFSGTTLRYIAIADQIKSLFNLPEKPKIVEIGAGFGGQCFVLSHLHPFSKYYIYDLPQASKLINKVLEILGVKHVAFPPLEEPLLETEIDLVISNYAFSECDKKTQLDYFDRIIKKAKRGYMIYNQVSSKFAIDSLAPNEFFNLLDQNHLHPKIEKELIQTHPGNILITWDIDREK